MRNVPQHTPSRIAPRSRISSQVPLCGTRAAAANTTMVEPGGAGGAAGHREHGEGERERQRQRRREGEKEGERVSGGNQGAEDKTADISAQWR